MAPTKLLFSEVDKSKQSTSSVRNDMLENVSDFSGLGWLNELESILGCTDTTMSRRSYIAAGEQLKSTATSLDDLDVMQEVVKDADDKLFICNNGKVASEDDTLDVGASKVGASKVGASKVGMDFITNGNDKTSKSTKSNTSSKDDLSSGGGVGGGAGNSKTPTKTNGDNVGSTKTLQSKSTSKMSNNPPTPLQQSNGQDNSPSRKSKTESKYHLHEAAEEKASAVVGGGGGGGTKRKREGEGDDAKEDTAKKAYEMEEAFMSYTHTGRKGLTSHLMGYGAVDKDGDVTVGVKDKEAFLYMYWWLQGEENWKAKWTAFSTNIPPLHKPAVSEFELKMKKALVSLFAKTSLQQA